MEPESMDALLGALREHERERPRSAPAFHRADQAPALERYEIREYLGEGGAAMVYGAFDTQLQRPVALKVLKRFHDASETARRRFALEARAAASLSHPHVVTVHDFGVSEGRPWIAMERIDGETWSRRLPGQPLADALAVLEKVALAVHAAHERGILHRDLKPANILIGRDGEPRVADFGLARALEIDSTLTQTGEILGTPPYMAPEQAEGSNNLHSHTDVYGLGAMLYEVLVGRPPHSGDTCLEVLRKVCTEDPVPPRTLVPGVPADLEAVALRALEKEPTLRYASAADFAEELARFRTGQPVRARRPGPAARAWRWARRQRAAAVLLALAMGWTGWLGAGLGRDALARAERTASDALLTEGGRALEVADRMRAREDARPEDLAASLAEARSSFFRIRSGPRAAEAHAGLARAAELAGDHASAEAEARTACAFSPAPARARLALGRALALRWILRTASEGPGSRNETDAAGEQIAEEAAGHLIAALGGEAGAAAERAWASAMLALLRGGSDKAYDAAAAAAAGHAGDPAEPDLYALAGIAGLVRYRGLFASAEEQKGVRDHAIECLSRAIALRPHDPLARLCRARLNISYPVDGEDAGLVADLDDALAWAPDLVPARELRAAVRISLGRTADAIADLDHSIRLAPENYGAWQTRGRARMADDDPAGAIVDFDTAIRLRPTDAFSFFYRGIAKRQIAAPREALADLDRTLKLDPGIAYAWYYRSLCHEALGDYDSAVQDLEAGLRALPAGVPDGVIHDRLEELRRRGR